PPFTVVYSARLVKGGANVRQWIAEGNSATTLFVRSRYRKAVYRFPTRAFYPGHDSGTAHQRPRAFEQGGTGYQSRRCRHPRRRKTSEPAPGQRTLGHESGRHGVADPLGPYGHGGRPVDGGPDRPGQTLREEDGRSGTRP